MQTLISLALAAQNIEETEGIRRALLSTGIENFMSLRDIIAFNTKKRSLKTSIYLESNDVVYLELNNLSTDEFGFGSPNSNFIYFEGRVNSSGEVLPYETRNGFIATIISEVFSDGKIVKYIIPENGYKILFF